MSLSMAWSINGEKESKGQKGKGENTKENLEKLMSNRLGKMHKELKVLAYFSY